MEIKGWRIDRLVITFLVITALFSMGERWLTQQRVQNPVLREINRLPGVKEARLLPDPSGGMTLEVRLEGVTDLAETYRAILNQAERLGNQPLAVKILDSRDSRLTELLHQVHFAIQEGIATGHFQAMAQEVANQVSRAGITHWYLTVTNDGVYLTLSANGHYLYAIFPRTHPEGTLGKATGGTRG